LTKIVDQPQINDSDSQKVKERSLELKSKYFDKNSNDQFFESESSSESSSKLKRFTKNSKVKMPPLNLKKKTKLIKPNSRLKQAKNLQIEEEKSPEKEQELHTMKMPESHTIEENFDPVIETKELPAKEKSNLT
jgi:hypothetical protein